MGFVILAVLCSVTVSVLIKWARMKSINYLQLIVWNYPVALLMTCLVLRPQLKSWTTDLPWELYLPLGFLLPSIFVCTALSIRYGGMIKTEIAQRLSLFIPLLAAYFWMGEVVLPEKFIGIGVGLVAIGLCLDWKGGSDGTGKLARFYPVLVLLGMGLIDILFKQIAQFENISYMSSLWIVFVLALIVALVFLGYLLGVKKERFDRRATALGAVLGLFNFGNIVFYMEAHRALPDSPSLVFTAMNLGVIAVGAIVGVVVFKEKLSFFNKIGVILAIISVLLIAYL